MTVANHDGLAIEASRVVRDFGQGKGVFDLSLALKWRSVVSLIGANGSGKSTFLRCLALFEDIDSGSISIGNGFHLERTGGRQSGISMAAIDAVRGRFLGLVFQNYELWPHLSVWDNLLLALRKGQCIPRAEADTRVEAILKDFEILGRARSMPYELSGGTRQRAAIAKALVLRPQVLLLDEVTSGLDPEWTEWIREKIRAFADAGGAVISVSHQLGFVRRLSDWVVFLDEGRIVEQGRPEEILSSPRSERLKLFVQNS